VHHAIDRIARIEGADVPIVSDERSPHLAPTKTIARLRTITNVSVLAAEASFCRTVVHSHDRIARVHGADISVVCIERFSALTDSSSVALFETVTNISVSARRVERHRDVVDVARCRIAFVQGAGVLIVKVDGRSCLTRPRAVTDFFTVAKVRVRT
jgi:hypothetical protein